MSDETVRTTASGQVRGRAFSDFTQWLGLPYASPPVGPLRWKTQHPPSNWNGIRDVTQYAPFSLQKHIEYSHARDGSEDCLCLNVYAPSRLSGPFPIIVWLHGGGFMNGSGNAFMGGVLAKEGAIVVMVNYRLGPFGRPALPSLAAEAEDGATGKYGLLDSIGSLRWIKHNIAAFGSESERVTIAEQSAGGEQVLAMLASPCAAGLFQRALSMNAPASLSMPDIQASLARRGQFLAHLGTTADAPLHELSAIPAEKLLDAAQES